MALLWKRVYIHAVVAGLIRKVCDPSAVRRKPRTRFMERRLKKCVWVSGPESRGAALDGQYPNIGAGCLAYLNERQQLTIRRKRHRISRMRALIQYVELVRSIRARPKHIARPAKHQESAVARPNRKSVTAAEREPGHASVPRFVYPEISRRDERDAVPIGRERKG